MAYQEQFRSLYADNLRVNDDPGDGLDDVVREANSAGRAVGVINGGRDRLRWPDDETTSRLVELHGSAADALQYVDDLCRACYDEDGECSGMDGWSIRKAAEAAAAALTAFTDAAREAYEEAGRDRAP